MSHQIDADYSKVYLLPPSIEDWVGPDDPARFIRAFVDSLDLKELGFKVGDDKEGRPAFSSSLLLKAWLYGCFDNIKSSRKLERQCRKDLALIWLTGMNYPDHNTLWRFFSKHKEATMNLFKKSIQVALKNDLIGMVYHAIDGTKVGANASRYKGMNKAEMALFAKRLEDHIESLVFQIENSSNTEPSATLPTELQNAKKLQEKVLKAVTDLSGKKASKLNPVDVESRMMVNNRKGVDFSYNAQAAVDKENDIIVGIEVSQKETDHSLLTGMVEEVYENLGKNAKYTVADAGYFSADELEKVEHSKGNPDVYVNIPKQYNSSKDKDCDHPYHLNNFVYDKNLDCYICPHGSQLTSRNKGRHVVYKCHDFSKCPHKSHCTKSKLEKKITVHENRAAIIRHVKKTQSTKAKELLRIRASVVEKVFGHIKCCLGLRRIIGFGMDNAITSWNLACTIHNLKKIYSIKGVNALFA